MEIKQYSVKFQDDTMFPLRVAFEPQTVAPLHSHEFVEIVVIIGGNGIHETKFSKHKITSGDVLVIPQNGVHGYPQVDNLELINILFDPVRLPIPLLDLYKLPGYNALFALNNDFFEKNRYYPQFHLQGQEFETVKSILMPMKNESEKMVPGYRLSLMGYFMVLLSNLCRFYSENLKDVHEPAMNVGKAISFLNTNYADDIKLPAIIKNAGMSKNTFLRNFERATGYAPINYLINIRIARACSLLRETTYSIAEISYKTGFNDNNYFSKTFKKIAGMTAREYRNQYLSIKE